MKQIKKNFSISAAEVGILRDALFRCCWKPEDARIAADLREKFRAVKLASVDVLIQVSNNKYRELFK